MPSLEMFITRDAVRKATNNVKHNVPMGVIESLPELLADPVLVLESSSEAGSLLIFLEAEDKSGRPVAAAIRMSIKKGRVEINSIRSVHGRESVGGVNRDIKNGLLRYYHTKKSLNLVRRRGLQLPKRGSPNQGSGRTVLTESDIVNNPPSDDLLTKETGSEYGEDSQMELLSDPYDKTEV